jgi:zinc transport system permease protein
MSIFEYPFMQRAFLVGVLLALIIPCVGIVIVLKRLSMIGDALSHTSLAGVAAGLLFNINPVLGATAACVAAAFGIEAIRKKLPRYAEMSIAIILSAGVSYPVLCAARPASTAFFSAALWPSATGNSIRWLLSAESLYWPFCSCTKNCFIWRWMNAPPGCLESP